MAQPAVAGGIVYAPASDGRLYAFRAAARCASPCAPLWSTEDTGSGLESSPAVANGVVYALSDDGDLFAFDGPHLNLV